MYMVSFMLEELKSFGQYLMANKDRNLLYLAL